MRFRRLTREDITLNMPMGLTIDHCVIYAIVGNLFLLLFGERGSISGNPDLWR